MLLKKLDKSNIKRILIISLSNIGDVILTFPAIDVIREYFPRAKISVAVGPKAQSLLNGNPNFEEIIIFDKRESGPKLLSWVMKMRKKRFDMVIDFRQSAIPLMMMPKYRTTLRSPVEKVHMQQKHLNRLKTLMAIDGKSKKLYSLFVSEVDRAATRELIKKEIGGQQPFVVFAPGAANHAKRWAEEGFAQVADHLAEQHNLKIVFIGDNVDRAIADKIISKMRHGAVNFCGRISLVQAAEVLRHSLLAIVNDSAPMHLASYLNVPVVAIFGPSDPTRYGPWSEKSKYIQGQTICRRCNEPKSKHEHTCMASIHSDDILKSFRIEQGKIVFS